MTSTAKRECSPSASGHRVSGILLVLAVLIGTAGYWGPWIAHRDAALILIGQDMGEFVKFLPQVRSGRVLVFRQIFYLPPFCACCILALLATSSALRYPPVVRVLFPVAILPVSLALLPPVFSIPVLKSEEFRLQVLGVIFCWALLPASLVLRHIPAFVRTALLTVLGLAGALLPLWQFLIVLPDIQSVYRAPVHIGWGIVATVAGFLATSLLGFVLTLRLLCTDLNRR